jgi:eukaryotic-like serine/threonine-protein kinase
MTPDLIAGRYRVVRPVGRGGMGTVWLCRDEVLGREVAVKQIGTLPGESATDAARALREARSSAALNHRNVVAVFDVVDTEDGTAWLVMEYVPSRTLGQIMREEGPLPPQRAAFIGAQVADGLAAAHAAGTMHRDVKPGNILVTEDDIAKISDFGIARGADDDQLTRTGLVTGTPSYFSPELARGSDPGPESDVYALGATLYAAVEGRPPYPEQRNPIALLQLIAAEEPPPPTKAGMLAGPITRMMDRDPRSRWTMADSAQALRRFAEQGDAGDEHTAVLAPFAADDRERGETTPVPAPAAAGTSAAAGASDDPEGRRRRKLLPWLAAAAVLLVVLLAGFMMLGDDTDEAPRAGGPETSPTAETSPTQEASPTPEASPSPTPTPEETPTRQPARDDDPDDAMEDAVEEYFSVMPGDTDAGWERLAPSMQSQGRDAYESWWGSIESIELHDADAVDGSQQVDIDLTYNFDDGRATRETQRLTLERAGERYLIADDEVLSSRTVS